MARPKGLSTSSVLQQMGNNPLHQLAYREATAAQGRDNKAVSMDSRILGEQLAGEQERLLGLDQAGRELSRRKDDLDFRRDVRDFEREQFSEQMRRRDLGLELGKQSLADYQAQTGAIGDDYEGLKMGLGLLSTGVEVYRSYKDSKNRKKEKALQESMGSKSMYGGLDTPNRFRPYGSWDVDY